MPLEQQQAMKKWYVLITVSLAIFIIAIDTTMMNVAITNLAQDLNTEIQYIQLAIAVYSLVMAAGMLLGAKLAKIFGTKRIFIIGIILYGIGTITAALSPNIVVLITGWSVIEGIGAAMILPTILSFLMNTYAGKDRVRAFAVYSAILVGGAAIGPIIGGLFTTYVSWRWAFGMEAFIVAAVLALSRVLVGPTKAEKRPGLDLGGVALSATGLVCLVAGVIGINTYGLWRAVKPMVVGGLKIAPFGISVAPLLMITGGILMLLFWLWLKRQERRGNEPLVPTSLFRNRHFMAGTSTNLILQMSIGATLFCVPYFLQVMMRANAFETGITLLPLTMAMLVLSLATARLASRLQMRYLTMIGIAVMIGGTILAANSFSPEMTMMSLAPGLTLIGAGMGLSLSQIGNITLSAAKRNEADEATGLYSTFLNLGRSIGTAAVGALMLAFVLSSLVVGVNGSATLPQEDKNELTVLLTDTFKQMEHKEFINKVKETVSQYPDEYIGELKEIGVEAADNAMRITFYTLAGVLGVSLVVSFFLPKRKLVASDETIASPG
jgi:MFS family permease